MFLVESFGKDFSKSWRKLKIRRKSWILKKNNLPVLLINQEYPYKWKQTLQDVDVTIPLPKGTKGRDLTVILSKTKIQAGLKNQEPILQVFCFFIRVNYVQRSRKKNRLG
jgi:hypothetical protein